MLPSRYRERPAPEAAYRASVHEIGAMRAVRPLLPVASDALRNPAPTQIRLGLALILQKQRIDLIDERR